MTYCFICYPEILQVLLLILCSLGGNIREVTAIKIDGAVLIFDMLLYKKRFLKKSFYFCSAMFISVNVKL